MSVHLCIRNPLGLSDIIILEGLQNRYMQVQQMINVHVSLHEYCPLELGDAGDCDFIVVQLCLVGCVAWLTDLLYLLNACQHPTRDKAADEFLF